MFKNVVIFLISTVFSVIAFAEPATKDITSSFDLPPSMKNCTIYSMRNDSSILYIKLYITHCPDAKTETVHSGKNPVNVLSADINSPVALSAVIDLNGDKYIPFDSVSNIDLSKVIELNGKKYVKLK